MTVIATHLDQDTCFKCARPPLTFDRQDRALCARHATIYLVGGRLNAAQSEAGNEDDEKQ